MYPSEYMNIIGTQYIALYDRVKQGYQVNGSSSCTSMQREGPVWGKGTKVSIVKHTGVV